METALAQSSRASILVVDDDLTSLRILKELLGRQGYQVLEVTSGTVALAAVTTNLPDLILLDIRLPDLNGYQICQHLKATESTRKIPVIFISALNEPIDIVKAFQVGGVDYITKPFQIEEVLVRIANQLTLQATQIALQQLNADLENRVSQRTAQLEAANRALREQKDLFQAIFHNASVGMVLVDQRGYVLSVNEANCAFLGYTAEELVGMHFSEFTYSADLATAQHLFEELVQQQRSSYCIEKRYRRKDGKVVWGRLNGSMIHNPQGQAKSTIMVCEDITAQKRIEHALHESELRFRGVLNSLNVIVWSTTPHRDQLIYLNPAAERVYGRPVSDFFAHPQLWLEVIHPDDRAMVQEASHSSVGMRLQDIEYRILRPDGTVRWLRDRGYQVCSAEGTVLRYDGIAYDVSDRKQVEQALRAQAQQEQQFKAELERQVADRTAELKQAHDFDALLKRITDKVRDSLDENQILQTAVQELALGLQVVSCDTALYDLEAQTSTIYCEFATSGITTAQGKVWEMSNFPHLYRQLLQRQEFQICDPHLIRGWMTLLACPIFDDQGILGDLWLSKPIGPCFSEQEIRLVQQVANHCAIAIRQARLYAAVQAKVETLETLNQLKDDFLSTVSHELRSPVTNMKMAIQMLELAVEPLLEFALPQAQGKVAQYLHILESECEREINLINDLLDLQRLEVKAYPLETEPLDLNGWLVGLVESFQQRARTRRQDLQVQMGDRLPLICSNLDALSRILSELLHNACKYTPPGEQIWLQVSTTPEHLIFQVTNDGVEIPEQELSRIFDKFYRIPSADRWQQGGTGLGLALVQKLVEHLQGQVRVESAPTYTTFTVELPLSLPDCQPSSQSDA